MVFVIGRKHRQDYVSVSDNGFLRRKLIKTKDCKRENRLINLLGDDRLVPQLTDHKSGLTLTQI